MASQRPEGEKQYFFDKARNIKRVLVGFLLVSAVVLGIDLFFDRHTDHRFEELVGFYGIWGFVSCVVLVLAARELRKLVMRKEDFYGD